MNKRLQKLAKEAMDYSRGWFSQDKYRHVEDMFNAKFAELIVRDAMDYASRNWENGHLLAEDLRIHFGIE
jgi:hypothetical protein